LHLPDLSGLGQLLPWLGGGITGAGGVRLLKLILRAEKDLKVCQVRVRKEGLQLPWDRSYTIHPLKDGRLKITPLP